MEMREFIEIGEKRAGKQIELAKYLGIGGSYVRMIKSGKKGLPDALCMKLAELIEEDPIKVISASNLVSEKNQERREIFEKYLRKTTELASVIAFIGVTSIMTLLPSNEATASPITINTLYYVKLD